MTALHRYAQSEYMLWAKTRQAATYNLANSGVTAVTRAELGIAIEDIELSGPSFYGWPPLIEALAKHLQVGQDRICHAEGTSHANYLAMAVSLQCNDEVLIEEPTYELLVDTARHLGAQIRRFPRRREDRFIPDPSSIKSMLTPRTRLIVLTNLHNPTSARIPDAVLGEIAAAAETVGAWVLVDEVYLDAAFDSTARSAHFLSDRILVTNSLTKVYGLSGLRCGWVLGTPDWIERMWRLNDLLNVIPAHAAERLSLLALQRLPALRERSLRILEPNRQHWNQFLASRPNLEDEPLVSGTVAFPRLKTGSVESLCSILRDTYETTVAPGAFFGMPDSFRVGLGMPSHVFMEGLRRLGLALDVLHHESK